MIIFADGATLNDRWQNGRPKLRPAIGTLSTFTHLKGGFRSMATQGIILSLYLLLSPNQRGWNERAGKMAHVLLMN
jgi:hypothetical protein